MHSGLAVWPLALSICSCVLLMVLHPGSSRFTPAYLPVLVLVLLLLTQLTVRRHTDTTGLEVTAVYDEVSAAQEGSGATGYSRP